MVEWRVSGGAGAGQAAARRQAIFNALNRNKRSIALNLKHGDAQGVLYRLVEDADVFVEGFRPGVVSRLGCDYQTLSEINPRLVYCSLSGYGQDGPYSNPRWARHQLHFCGRSARSDRGA